MTVLERSLTEAEVVCDTIEASIVASCVLVCDDDNEEEGFDKEGFEVEAATSGGAPVVVFEGMDMFDTGADGGGLTDDTLLTGAALEFQ